jgi:hypothetical protein
MSNKHDNIYNILGKLDALTPKQAPVEQTPAKTINESVEARGSVLEGVAKVEARLAEMFNQQGMEEDTTNAAGQRRLRDAMQAAQEDGPEMLAYFAIAAMYGNNMWDNDAMGDLVNDLEQTNPTEDELKYIIVNKTLPTRLKSTRFTNTDDVQFGHMKEESDWSNLGAEYRSTKPGTKEPTHTGEKEYFKGGVRHTKDYDREVSHKDATGEKRGRGRPKKSQFEEGQLDELSPELVNKTYQARQQQASAAAKPMKALWTQRNQETTAAAKAANPNITDRELSNLPTTGYTDADQPTIDAHRKAQAKLDKNISLGGNLGYARYSDTRKGDRRSYWDPTDMKGQNIHKASTMAESINFAEMMKEQHQTVDEYLSELNADIDTFKKSGHMSEKLRDSLEMHKFSKKQLNDATKQPALAPAPTATAVVAPAPKPPGMLQRAGSAIAGGINKVIGHPSDAEMLDKLKKDTMGEDLNELARLAGISEGLTKKQKTIAKAAPPDDEITGADLKALRDKVAEAFVDEDMIKANDDYDKDGEVETGSEEHAGSVDNAIKKAQAKKDLDEETHGQYLTQKEKEAQASGKKSFQAFKQTHPVDGKPGVEEEDEESLEEAKLPMKTVNGKKVPAFAADGKGKNDLQKEKVDECGPEMSPFSSMGHDEPESGMSINSSMDTKTGRKTLTVTADGEAAEELAQMLKMAGMGGQSREPKAVVVQAGPEEAVEEEREGQYANTPDEEVENIDSIMHQGNDLNREKEQYADKPKTGDNPMATRESIEMPRSLSKMLEAIKMVEEGKCNHTDKGEKCPVHGMKECSGMYEGFLGKLLGTEKKKKAAGELRPYMVYDKFTIYVDPVDEEWVVAGTGEYENKFEPKSTPMYGQTGHTDLLVMYAMKHTGGGSGIRDPLKVNKEALRGLQEAKPSAGMSKGEKSSLVKKAQAGGDIGKPGKSFDKVAKAAGGGEKGKRIAAAAMWKNAAK